MAAEKLISSYAEKYAASSVVKKVAEFENKIIQTEAKVVNNVKQAFNKGKTNPLSSAPAKNSPKNVANHERYKADLAQQEALSSVPVGSALKSDAYHIAAEWGINSIKHGKHFTIVGRDGKNYNLTQIEGSFNKIEGVFEYIVNSQNQLTHQRFIPKGIITGKPNQNPKKIFEGS